MKYMLLIYTDPDVNAGMTEAGWQELGREYIAFTEELVGAGKMVAGDPLDTTGKGAAVQIRGGETLLVDGPYTETKETLGGYYIVDCDDLEEAKSWAAKIPTARTGTIEVRPLGVNPTA